MEVGNPLRYLGKKCMKDWLQKHRRGNTSIHEDKNEFYYWFDFFFLSITNLYTCMAAHIEASGKAQIDFEILLCHSYIY